MIISSIYLFKTSRLKSQLKTCIVFTDQSTFVKMSFVTTHALLKPPHNSITCLW